MFVLYLMHMDHQELMFKDIDLIRVLDDFHFKKNVIHRFHLYCLSSNRWMHILFVIEARHWWTFSRFHFSFSLLRLLFDSWKNQKKNMLIYHLLFKADVIDCCILILQPFFVILDSIMMQFIEWNQKFGSIKWVLFYVKSIRVGNASE